MSDTEKTLTAPAPEAAEKASKATKARPKKGKKKAAQVTQGSAYIQATFNNTIVTLTDLNGNALSWSSAGVVGFKGPKKATPYAASIIVKDAVEKAAAAGLKDVHVLISGIGQGREGALRALHANNLNILSIKDVTPVPHNGCRPPRPRRV
jgi:small subunit ribosomal protein S11